MNPSKSFLALKKVNPMILSTFQRLLSKKNGKNTKIIIIIIIIIIIMLVALIILQLYHT